MEKRRFIPINKPLLDYREIRAVNEVLKSGALTNPSPKGGEKVREFEKALSKYLNVREVVAVNSGTAALYASLLALNVKPRAKVLVPSLTFVSTVNTVLLAGLKPVFVDINLEDYTIDVEDVKRKVDSKCAIIIPVHIYGFPANMDELAEIAEKYSLSVIEDAAQALGTVYKGRKVGTIGLAGCFSFYPGKVMTTGEGGAIATSEARLAERLRRIRTHGQVRGYDTERLGLNLRMPEMEAAIGLVQLKKLEAFLAKRRRNALLLTEQIQERGLEEYVIAPRAKERTSPNWYLYTIRVKAGERERDRVLHYLNESGIGAAAYYPTPVHKTPLYAKLKFNNIPLPNTELASKSVLSLPVHPAVNEEDIEYMAVKLEEALKMYAR